MSADDEKWVARIHRNQGIFLITIRKEMNLKPGDRLAFSRAALARLIRFEQDIVGVWKDVS